MLKYSNKSYCYQRLPNSQFPWKPWYFTHQNYSLEHDTQGPIFTKKKTPVHFTKLCKTLELTEPAHYISSESVFTVN